ncbi:hypothetical protein HMN09_00465500 [Mycena chlorophos]|uniref:Uncharacterized protein n=1 Tax=Mycena chlorophos TaxID=658473 RepID=A0A8H6TED9_MYCCL|nr:hypothetical protein HMN09_00465500 [Mycena chlorophos]
MVLIKPDTLDAEPPPYLAAVSTASSSPTTSSASETFVYYILRDDNGSPLSPNTSSAPSSALGRIPLRAIPPPRTISVLKRCIASAEGLTNAVLYADQHSQQPVAESVRVGSSSNTEDTPFVVQGTRMDSGPGAGLGFEHLYYRLYTSTGEGTSALGVRHDDPSLGRISKDHLSSLECYAVVSAIAQAEGKTSLFSAEVYASTEATEPLDGREQLQISSGVGRSEETAFVLVTNAEAEMHERELENAGDDPSSVAAGGGGGRSRGRGRARGGRGDGHAHGHGPSRGRGGYSQQQPQNVAFDPFHGQGPFGGTPGRFGPSWPVGAQQPIGPQAPMGPQGQGRAFHMPPLQWPPSPWSRKGASIQSPPSMPSTPSHPAIPSLSPLTLPSITSILPMPAPPPMPSPSTSPSSSSSHEAATNTAQHQYHRAALAQWAAVIKQRHETQLVELQRAQAEAWQHLHERQMREREVVVRAYRAAGYQPEAPGDETSTSADVPLADSPLAGVGPSVSDALSRAAQGLANAWADRGGMNATQRWLAQYMPGLDREARDPGSVSTSGSGRGGGFGRGRQAIVEGLQAAGMSPGRRSEQRGGGPGGLHRDASTSGPGLSAVMEGLGLD